MTSRDAILSHFPDAMASSQLRKWFTDWLVADLGRSAETTLLATSFCADDIILSKDIGRTLHGPFTLGGLAGFPFTGRTGFHAFAHHVPDGGTALIVYGPHIGMTGDGLLGMVRRSGQGRETSCCGALLAALNRLRQPDASPAQPASDTNDWQEEQIVRRLGPYASRILAASSPEKEITEVAYELIHGHVQELLQEARHQFHGALVVSVGGIVINTDHDEEEWFDVRDRGSG